MTERTVQPLELSEAEPRAGERAPLLGRDLDLIRHVNVRMSAVLGGAALSVDALFALKNGDVVELDQGLDEPLTFMLDGKPVARGELVAVDDRFGVRITELL